MLLYPPGLDYIAAFFGCLYAGFIAVPAYPPRLNRPVPRIQAIVADAGATVALTTTQFLENLEQRFDHARELRSLHWLNTDKLDVSANGAWQPPPITPDTLAFLQYTSGSTSTPKGVQLSHGNLIHNIQAIARGFHLDDTSKGVFWLPSYHDMGLIGGILTPMYINGPSHLMSPAAFLQRPIRWLATISGRQGVISGAPNFAFQMAVDKITPEQRSQLDLSGWELAFCGAEPIRPETLERFAETFAAQGFRSNAFYPCYGLAEATLLVAGGDGPGPIEVLQVAPEPLARNRVQLEVEANSLSLVSNGRGLAGQEFMIVNPDTLIPCAPDEVGEIWLQGPSVAQGYWNRPEASQETFGAYLADRSAGPFLRTGDMGFLHEENLFVTGRLKDLLIIRGRNHYPQDIEHSVANSHFALNSQHGAAFTIDVDGEERLVVVHEVIRTHRKVPAAAVAAAARATVAEYHGLQLHALVLVSPFALPKTSSGKIKRHACRRDFLAGDLKVLDEWHLGSAVPLAANRPATSEATGDSFTPNAIIDWLVTHLAAALKLTPDQIDIRQPFSHYGLDSVQAVSLAGDLETWLDRSLPPTLVWDYPTINSLADYLSDAPPRQPPPQRRPVTRPTQ